MNVNVSRYACAPRDAVLLAPGNIRFGTGRVNLDCRAFILKKKKKKKKKNNNTQKAALAKLPLTTHPHERAEPHTLQT